jgi:4'-phosphopantetheinyl transferase
VGILKVWTLKEAYCKYSNIDMLSSLNKKPGLDNVSYFNFLLNGKYILSIVTEMGQHIFNLSYLDLSYLDLSYLDLSCLEKINSYQGEAVWKTTENLSKQE